MFHFQILQRRSHIAALIMLIFVVTTMTYFSNAMARRLAEDEESKMLIWAEAYRVLGSENSSEEAINLAMEIIRTNETIPLLITDQNESITSRNIKLPKKGQEEYLKNKLEEYKRDIAHPPIEVSLNIGTNTYTNLIYYGRSNLLKRLALFPLWQVSIVMIFMIAAYVFFNISKRSEENRVWVGLSKETAHQLGTPISSLNAWIELLRSGHTSTEMPDEMQKDINRLQTVANRFSKIGSKPTLKIYNLSEILYDASTYMSKRITRKVKIKQLFDKDHFVPAMLSEELFEWVIENLIKNAVDAMRGGGHITVQMTEDENYAYIDIVDEGKGITKNQFKQIFRPGFSSKKRGWGLGLSFAKRIINDYHGGKIFVKSSEIDKGTTFKIILPKTKEESNAKASSSFYSQLLS